MRKIYVFMSAAVIALLSSCAKEEIAAPDCTLDSNVLTFTAAFEEPTKTVLDEEGNVTWAAGDQIKFDFEVGKEDLEPVVSAPLAESDIDEQGASFSAAVPEAFAMTEKAYKESLEEGQENSRHMYVAYPASLDTEYGTVSYYVTIPSEQKGDFASASIALSKWNPAKPTGTLHFRNLCALVKFTVPDSYTTVREIRFTAHRAIVGKANVGFSETVPFTPYIKNMVEDQSSTTLTVKVNGPGTYYSAVAPGELKDICLAYFDADGKPVGEIVSPKGFNAERSKIYNITTNVPEGNFPGEGGYFVKPDGTGDGSSWDNAANYDTFRAKLAKSVNDEVAVVHMAAGEYTVSAVANVGATGKDYTILGGYPADATGYSLSGRDIFAHPTVLVNDETVDNHRVWNFKYGTYRIEGISFKGFKYSDGSVLQVQYTTNVTCKDCVFEDCLGTKNGGAVYFSALTSTGSVFENCSFVNNSTDGSTDGGGYGGAVGAFGTYGGTIGLVTFKNCLFKGNNAKNAGGAVASRITSMRFTDCNFVGNTTTPTTNHPERSSGIFVDGSSAALSIYCDRCYFANSNDISNKHTSIIANNTAAGASICVNNSVLAGYWGYGNSNQVANTGNGLILISNSTLIAQSGAQLYSNSADARIVVINSIVANAASAKLSAKSDAGTISLNYSLCSATQVAENAVLESNNITTIDIRSDAEEAIKFPTDETPWIVGGAPDMRNNNRTKSAAVTDCRGKMYYYDWDGAYPAGATFTNTTLENVTNLVKAADAGFAEWLGANSTDSNDNRLGKDIRGEARNAASMWPGSYQK